MNNPYLMEKVEVLDITPETAIDRTFTLAWDKPLKPGQFFQVSIPGIGEAPISVSDFEEGRLSMTIRRVGRLTDAVFGLRAGDHLFVRGPYGNGFEVSDYYGSHLKVIAGGTGLAPVKKLIKDFIGSDKIGSLEVLLGFKSPDDILYRDEIQAWVNSGVATLTLDKGDENWNGNTGLITEYIPKLNPENRAGSKFIVVGPPVMIKFVILELLKLDIPEENIWVSFERKMSCGIGKCGHCKIDDTYVCLEGPVFVYSKAKRLLD